MHEIRFCEMDEVEQLQRFIDTDWSKAHILSLSMTLLNWQHLDKQRKRYNYVVAFHKRTGTIDAILGFIPTYHFDPSLTEEIHLWLAIWKVNHERAQKAGLGLELLDYLQDQLKPSSIGSIGINPRVRKLYKALNWETAALNHYYVANPFLSAFKILDRGEKKDRGPFQESNSTIREIFDLTHLPSNLRSPNVPLKSLTYMRNRYCGHAFYRYRFFGAFTEDASPACLFVVRKIAVGDTSCLRIVDLYGDPARVYLRGELLRLVGEEQAEYVDILNFGIPETIFYDLGFEKVPPDVTVPNHFEPFERKRVDIQVAFKSTGKPYTIFKGDSDQDRPNLIGEKRV